MILLIHGLWISSAIFVDKIFWRCCFEFFLVVRKKMVGWINKSYRLLFDKSKVLNFRWKEVFIFSLGNGNGGSKIRIDHLYGLNGSREREYKEKSIPKEILFSPNVCWNKLYPYYIFAILSLVVLSIWVIVIVYLCGLNLLFYTYFCIMIFLHITEIKMSIDFIYGYFFRSLTYYFRSCIFKNFFVRKS